MCGRFTLTTSGDVVAEFFQLADAPELTPRYNIAPTQAAPVVLMDGDAGKRVFRFQKWGLIPPWAKDPGIGARMINARAETVATKPAYRSAFRNRRCLIVTDGYYEWQSVAANALQASGRAASPSGKSKRRSRKQPYYIHMKEGRVFALAGLWERWTGSDGSVIESCAVITTEPSELVRPLHDRMPVILHASQHDQWLGKTSADAPQLQSMLSPYPIDEMAVYPVATHVNSPAHDAPTCVVPLQL